MKFSSFFACIALSTIYCVNFVTSEVLPYSGDCKKYQVCDYSGCFVFNCGEGTEFNPKISVCDFPIADRESCSSFDYSGSIKTTPTHQNHDKGSYQEAENDSDWDSDSDSNNDSSSNCNKGLCHSQAGIKSSSKCKGGKGSPCNNGVNGAYPPKHGSDNSYPGNQAHGNPSQTSHDSTSCSQGKGGPCNQGTGSTYQVKHSNPGNLQTGNPGAIHAYPGNQGPTGSYSGNQGISSQGSSNVHVIKQDNPGSSHSGNQGPSPPTSYTPGNHGQVNSYVGNQSPGNQGPTNSYPGGQGPSASFQGHQTASNSYLGTHQSGNQGHVNPFLNKQVAGNTFSSSQGHSNPHSGIQGHNNPHSGIQGMGNLGTSACSQGKGPCNSQSGNQGPHNPNSGNGKIFSHSFLGIDFYKNPSQNQDDTKTESGHIRPVDFPGIHGNQGLHGLNPGQHGSGTLVGGLQTSGNSQSGIKGPTPCSQGKGPCNSQSGNQGPHNPNPGNGKTFSHSFLGIDFYKDPSQNQDDTTTESGHIRPVDFPGIHGQVGKGPQPSANPFSGNYGPVNSHVGGQGQVNSYSESASMVNSYSVNQTPLNPHIGSQNEYVQRNEHQDNLYQQKQLDIPRDHNTNC